MSMPMSVLKTFCLCVKEAGEWVPVETLQDSDQLKAYDRAVARLPEPLRDKPVMFRASHL